MPRQSARPAGPPSRRVARHEALPSTRWGRFARRWGWRAYALPLLGVMTVAVAVQQGTADAGTSSAAGHHSSARVATTVRHRVAAAAPPSQTVRLAADTGVCSVNRYAKQVIVSIHDEHLWACDRHRQVLSTPVTTGRAGDGTPVGSWRVQGKQTDRYLVGPGYRDYVHFWVPFNGDFGLHDAPWQKVPYGTTDFHNEGSHGCVHVPETMMAWIYHWAVTGKTVVTINR